MEIGNTIYIRNSAGKLKVILDKQLDIKDVTRGRREDSLPTLKQPRMEFHKRDGEVKIITLYDNAQDEPTKENPNEIYVTFLDYDEVEVWKAYFDSCEEDEYIYETIE